MYASAVAHDLTLIRVEGPDDPLVAPRLVLTRDTVIGRAVESDLCLPSSTVSRRHATVRRAHGGWYLTDDHSTAGTTLNARRLDPDAPAPLEPGDRIAIGPWLFRVSDTETATRTVELTLDKPTASVAPISTRRLDALSACLDALELARTPEELAMAALQAAMDGTGFGRAAVLLPPTAAHANPALLAGLVRTRSGTSPLDPDTFAPSSSLIDQARRGHTAVHTERSDADRPSATHSLSEMSIHSAVCVPVTPDGRVAAMLYLDARRGESPVRDAAGFCEDIARLYAFALTRDAQADLKRRQEALRIELERARELRAMLAPPETGRAGAFRHASRTIAGLFVSADLFDAIPHPDDSATVLFGDASGHGVGAAMLAALVHAHLASALSTGHSLTDAVTQTNRFVASRPTGGRFVSLVAASLAPDGSVSLVDAGHGHWVIARAGASPVHPERATSYPLGIDPDARFDRVHFGVRPGDRIIFYTDGIPDQISPAHEPFGFDRLDAAVRTSHACETDVSHIFDALQRHAGGRPLDDDATVASVQLDPM